MICLFWDNYLYYCNKYNYSPNSAAASVGVKSSGTVTGWSNGAKPRTGVLFRLASLFNCSVEDLLAEKETPAAQGDGLTDKQSLLIALFERLTEAQQDFVIAQLQGAAQSPPDRGAR